ncbi:MULTISPECIES: AraC family transcriptional regulator [Pseudonocardia]|uniref:HTH-type transcriptional regulator CdhR n=2 Tax=Pseudonocardia TaxID=1847 RepID=A0A1Y2MJI0_PSEAH|nr:MULTISPECIES: AraC family transcriptional regulator [Pseudonocardia]OSY35159.1 HTH-type transcriptional regulator CdhR [Pseudonocardia autotrophica]TDN74970.1 AraC-like DNA-binding protein [Pseudonocardia autotrophica]
MAGSAPSDVTRPDARRLSRGTGFSTPDPRRARTRTEAFLDCAHAMAVRDESRFRAQVRFASVGGIGLLATTYRTPVAITCVPPIPWVTLNFLSTGSAVSSVEGSPPLALDADRATVFTYDRPLTIRMSPEAYQLMVLIDRRRLETALERMLGRRPAGPLSFEAALDVGSSSVTAAVSMLLHVLRTSPSGRPPPAVAAEAERSLVSALLLGQRHRHTRALFAEPERPPPRTVARVVELIESSTDESLGVADLAREAGISERALHAAFRRHTGSTPMAYLRRVRLDRVRAELAAADPVTGSVTEVALRHGFGHLGRFAAAYRARFGESPSTTLRR